MISKLGLTLNSGQLSSASHRRALEVCHGWQVLQTYQPIEILALKNQTSFARLIG
jgi:hypothetical protein